MQEMPLVKEFEARTHLAPHARKLTRYLRGIRSEWTSDAVQKRFLAFIRWTERIETEERVEILPLPVEWAHVLRYAKHLDSLGLAMMTIHNYLSAIGSVHRALGFFDPASHPDVRSFLAELRQRHAHKGPRRATALSEEQLACVLHCLHNPRSVRGRRMEAPWEVESRAAFDRAMLLTMYEAGLRRGEAARLTWGDLEIHPDGSGRLRVRSGRSAEAGHVAPITANCVRALTDIRPQSDAEDCRIFELSESQISRRLKKMCEQAGIDPDDVNGSTPRATLVRILTDRGLRPK